jgi:hypothetical protein
VLSIYNIGKLVEKYWLDGALAEESGYFSTGVAIVVEKYWLDEGKRIFFHGGSSNICRTL